jgi:branched-chain amino acid transport system substrate-binding protein
MFLASVHDGKIDYRRITMEKPYARVNESAIEYAGPTLPDEQTSSRQVVVFGPQANQVVESPQIVRLLQEINPKGGQPFSLIAIPSELSWGKASDQLVQAVYQHHALAMIALDRPSSHLAEQIAVKSFVPVIAISSDHALTTTNIPWIFRLPENTPLAQAIRCLAEAIDRAGPNRGKVRDLLSSGTSIAGLSFETSGEPHF